ncbi:tubulin-like doman-containing protein [Spirillospora sp. CA-253888]
MKLQHPVMFVGLGGTGCRIGAELERRLRAEICGPDGTDFRRRRPDALRYELPACLQFVYADVNQSDLDRLPALVVPGERHIPATRPTAHYVRGLVPQAHSYPELARNLRLWAPEAVDWLPPAAGEPRVSPLQRGAGQLPTIGRAVLFDTFRNGTGPVVQELKQAIGRLSAGTAATDLYELAGGAGGDASTVDVFVAFSVAGGTGAGLFHDFLHLVAEQFSHTRITPKIYPLVLMPSAFPTGLGGGRPAELNAARALLDLFRLVDQQNFGDADLFLEPRPVPGVEDVAVRRPDGHRVTRISMRPGIAQTGFLFSRPVGVEPEDLRGSVVALVLALIGTELDERVAADGEQHQSFADSFVNAAVERQIPAQDGIGGRGVSTALVASLATPVDELADMVAGRLLADGLEQLAAAPGAAESNRAHIVRFCTEAGINDVLVRAAADFAEPEPVRGAREVILALGDRQERMREALEGLRSALDERVSRLAAGFDPRRAVTALLEEHDPFRVQRIVFGQAEGEELDRLGVEGLLTRRRQAPDAPALDGGTGTPRVPDLRNRRGGFAPVRWSDPEPTRARQEQDAWYEWRTRVLWAEPWSRATPRWRHHLDRTAATLRALTAALTERARQERERSGGRAERLRRSRVGLSYLLPSGGDLETFHRTVLRRMTQAQVEAETLRPGARDGDLLHALLGPDGWREAFAALHEDGGGDAADRAVDDLKSRLKTLVKEFVLRSDPVHGPLLPRLGGLLAEAAGRGPGRLGEQELEPLRARLAGLVPPDFTPQGRGPMKVLVSYPAATADPRIADYLRRTLDLPESEATTYQFTPTSAERISVVLFRTSMGITDVREVREVLRTWADALETPQQQDYLRWRQRTGYDFGYLATREEHRVEILHRLLCAMWNGRATVDGDPASPIGVTLRLSAEVAMTLPLQPLDRASSWGGLLRSYEMCAFADDGDLRRDCCARLMREVPDGVGTQPKPPHPVYLMVRSLADEQITVLDRLAEVLHPSVRTRARQLRDFWARTLPAALEREFTGVHAIRRNLRELEKAVNGQEGGWTE